MELSHQEYEKVLEKILEVGIQLTTEKNRNRLLDSILKIGMEITHCDAATLYLYEDDLLKFKIMRTISKNISRGQNGAMIDDMPPVPFKEENVCAYSAIHREIVNILDVYHSDKFDFSGPRQYDALTGYRTKSMLVIPLVNNENELIGVLQMINAQNEQGGIVPFHSQYEMIICSLGSLAAIELSNICYLQEIKEQTRSFVEAMASVVDERTPYNGNHTRKVAEYTLILADKINQEHEKGNCEDFFDQERKESIELAALLHDIGKMILPRTVMNRGKRLDKELMIVEDRFELLKTYFEIDYLKGKIRKSEYEQKCQGLTDCLQEINRFNEAVFLQDEDLERVRQISELVYIRDNGERISYLTEQEKEYLSIRKGTLTEKDRKLMESHVVMTSKILEKVKFNHGYNKISKWAAEHHEFLDGSGYPNGLKGDEIELETRMLTVADIYDALTAADRPYKKPMPMEKGLAVLKEMAEEGKLDEKLVVWFSEAIKEESV